MNLVSFDLCCKCLWLQDICKMTQAQDDMLFVQLLPWWTGLQVNTLPAHQAILATCISSLFENNQEMLLGGKVGVSTHKKIQGWIIIIICSNFPGI